MLPNILQSGDPTDIGTGAMRANFLLPPLAMLLAACSTTTRTHFRRADVNHDSRLDKQEFTDGVANIVMEKFDTDKNGTVSLAEWRTLEGTGNDKGFKQRDANHDGGITLPETRQMTAKGPRFERLFEEIDANKDGAIEWSEVEAYKKAHPEPAKTTDKKTDANN